ncbi:MAG: hypothetical protein LBI43_03125 [Streptococcaceae bacterium]|jgi:hypothetical protein|nr:hypothetical protein [Streptococcaceae bacterium]
MAETDYIDLAIKYGGYMEMDKAFLKERLSNLTDAKKAELLVPPPSVINAYFSELYQKRAPKEATYYFFGMSKAFGMFYDAPEFDKEGTKDYELFRFIRLNIDGRAYGYSYLDRDEEACVFSQLPETPTENFLMHLAQIFPQYVIYETDEGAIHMRPKIFDKWSENRDMTSLTETTENADFIRYQGYNLEDVIDCAKDTHILGTRYYQYFSQKFTIYQHK